MSTRDLDKFLRGPHESSNGNKAPVEYPGGGLDRRRAAPASDSDVDVPVSGTVPEGIGDQHGTRRTDRVYHGRSRVHAGGGYGQRGGVYQGSFNCLSSSTQGSHEAPLLLIEGPADLWAALMLTVERDAFGHDPRPRAADEARASITAELDRMDPGWRQMYWIH